MCLPRFCTSLPMPDFTLDMGGACDIILLFGVKRSRLFSKHPPKSVEEGGVCLIV